MNPDLVYLGTVLMIVQIVVIFPQQCQVKFTVKFALPVIIHHVTVNDLPTVISWCFVVPDPPLWATEEFLEHFILFVLSCWSCVLTRVYVYIFSNRLRHRKFENKRKEWELMNWQVCLLAKVMLFYILECVNICFVLWANMRWRAMMRNWQTILDFCVQIRHFRSK